MVSKRKQISSLFNYYLIDYPFVCLFFEFYRYVINVGYLMVNINAAASMWFGIVYARSFCSILEELSTIPGASSEITQAHKFLKVVIPFMLIATSIVFCTSCYTIVTKLKLAAYFQGLPCLIPGMYYTGCLLNMREKNQVVIR